MKSTFSNGNDFIQEVLSDPTSLAEIKEDPKKFLENVEIKNPLQTDRCIYRILVSGLVITILAIITFVFVLLLTKNNMTDAQIPTIFTAIGSAAIGALAGLIAPSPKQV